MLNNHANRRYFLALLAVLFLGALPFVPAFHAHVRRPNAIAAPPPAPVRPVMDEYFGVKVVDPYRYMEDLKDPRSLRGSRRKTITRARFWPVFQAAIRF
jgi:hypothetical protein